MKYSVRHTTTLSYARPVANAQFNLRLLPIDWPGQHVTQASLTLTPQPHRRRDVYGPYLVNVTHAEFLSELEKFEITSSFDVDVTHGPLASEGPSAAAVRQQALATQDLSPSSPAPYVFPSRLAEDVPEIGAWAAEIVDMGGPVLGQARALMHAINTQFAYAPGATTSATHPAECFGKKAGVCQDFAHVMTVALRWLGLPCAYASGYLRTVPPPGQKKLVGADRMHAWVSVWCGEELGWVGLDPTNDCLAREDHVLIAMGRDYADVAPIDGVFVGAAPQQMDIWVDVEAEEEPESAA